jgi:uroporphyrinogen decarboxylase
MMTPMTKRERLMAAIEGRPVDRPPVSLWRHWPVDDQRPAGLARATVDFQMQYDFDFVKVTPASSFCLRDWGAVDEWRGHDHGTREYGPRVIGDPAAWHLLEPLEPSKGALGAQLEALRLIREALGPDVPVIQTIFSPLSQARNLAGLSRLLAHLRQAPAAVESGLRVIEQTTAAFVSALMEQGAVDGIFYAVQHAQAHLLTPDEYRQFGRLLDLQILSRASDGWLNVLHLHGTDVYFDLVADYPVQVVNWHDRDTPPTLANGKERFPGAVCGGIRQEETLVLGTPAAVEAEVADAIAQTGGRRLIIGTGCITPTTAPAGNIRAARQAVETD